MRARGSSDAASLHIDNRTDLSILSAFFNEVKIRSHNVDSMILFSVTLVYALNTCMIADWLLDLPPILQCRAARRSPL